jgi:hypothetical protein
MHLFTTFLPGCGRYGKRVVADMENDNSGNLRSRWCTMVVLPAPEGAEKMMSLPFAMFVCQDVSC